MNIDALLTPRSDDAPSGEDLEYDPVFTELEIAAQPGEERQVGDEIIPAEDPDYKEVAKLATQIAERSHDLRAGVFLAEAQLRLKGLPGFAAATTYIARCLDEYWDSCHPQLDEDDDDDPTMRINAVLALADATRIVRGVRLAPLTQSRTFGAISLRDIAVAEGEMTATSDMDTIPDQAQVAAAFQDTDDETLQEISEAAQTALADVEKIAATFDERTPGQGPDLDPLLKALRQAVGRLGGMAGGGDDTDAAEVSSAPTPASAPMGGAPAGSGGGGGGAITSSNDVMNALDRIMAYYSRYEPSSPVPVLLMRAKRLVNADFLTIVKDMAPDGVDNVNLIGGLSDEDSDSGDDYDDD